jgi:phosphoribosyl 1,2-cyclic phosphodiesterase
LTVRVTVMGSGSKGNCLVVEMGGCRIAVDAGFGPRTLAKRFKAMGIAPDSVQACVLTHEHTDHSCGALAARRKWHWTLVATAPTLASAGAANATTRVVPLAYETAYTVANLRLTLLRVSHDAVAPAAVLVEDAVGGGRIGIAYDLGEIPPGLDRAFERLDLLVLEANHDPGLLRTGPYPPFLQDRVAGRQGHLSNEQSAAFARRVAHRGLRALVLAHLSEQNNTPAIARSTVGSRLRGTGFQGALVTASQSAPCVVGTRGPEQLTLF